MKNTGRVFISIIFIFLLNILISSSAPDTLLKPTASSSNIKQQINTQGSDGSTVDSKTDIIIECDGIKKEYHSDKAENVTLSCDETAGGTVKNTVNITTQTTPISSTTVNPTKNEDIKKVREEIEEKKKDIQKDVKSARDEVEKKKLNILDQLKELFENAFNLLRF